MPVFRHSMRNCKKGFANHFVLLLQFHESRNAAERKKERKREIKGEGEESKKDREREIVSGISGSLWYRHTLQQQRVGWHCIKTLKLMIQI